MVAAGSNEGCEEIHRAIDARGLGPYQWRLLGIAGIGWATDGMEMFVMALILPELATEWQLTADQLGTLGGASFFRTCILLGILSRVRWSLCAAGWAQKPM